MSTGSASRISKSDDQKKWQPDSDEDTRNSSGNGKSGKREYLIGDDTWVVFQE